MKVTCSNCGAVLGKAKDKNEALNLATQHAPKCTGEVSGEDWDKSVAEAQQKKKGGKVFLHA